MAGTARQPAALARCTPHDYEHAFAGRHRLHDIPHLWERQKPESLALIEHPGRELSWRAFTLSSRRIAARLHALGLRRGDFLAVSLPFSIEHVLLEYGCFQSGVIHVPLDLRLPPAEIARSLEAVEARAYVSAAGASPGGVEFGIAAGVLKEWAEEEPERADLEAAFRAAEAVSEFDAAQAIFTTGSTGTPKPALLSHRGITCQNMCLGAGFGFGEHTRLLVNLPASHVGGQAETLMTTLFCGGTAVLLPVFDAALSLEAVERHRVNLLGQVPAMYQLEWRLSGYSFYDLSSLEVAIYGGQQASQPFLERLASMAPRTATGLGLTEASGFCTYTTPGPGVVSESEGIGFAMPIFPMSIREPMRDDGSAGPELAEGETGHVCFRGPQTFLGYAGQPEATAGSVSSDEYLYTGDMGSIGPGGLRFAGRAKWVIKPAGYQVFPGDVEKHLCALAKVAAAGVVGAPHRVFSEAVVAFVEKRPGADLAVAELRLHARGLAGYMRPRHYVLLEPGAMPLNRIGKTDYMRLQELALAEVEQLRSRRRWDR
jgi:fatty-acyl-CoA synthase